MKESVLGWILLFGLQRVDGPVGRMVELRLMVHVVLAGHLVDHGGGGRVLDQKAGLGVGVGGPDAAQDAAPSVPYPEAGVLCLGSAGAARGKSRGGLLRGRASSALCWRPVAAAGS